LLVFLPGGTYLLPFKLKVGDFFIAAVIVVIAVVNLALFTFKSSDHTSAVIIRDGKVARTIDLSSLTKKVTVQFTGKYRIVIAAENGRICFAEANCPDKVCVHTGWISKPGQSAACLPARIIIKVTAGKIAADKGSGKETTGIGSGSNESSGDKNTNMIITEDKNKDMDIKLK
jgi:hypothetical protein